jgi:ABC-type nitrate/sulfonate/bicarbonate transport system permease component
VTALTELIAAKNGIGYMLQYQRTQLSIEGILTWTLLFMVVILSIEYGVFQQMEKRVFSWRDNNSIGLMG